MLGHSWSQAFNAEKCSPKYSSISSASSYAWQNLYGHLRRANQTPPISRDSCKNPKNHLNNDNDADFVSIIWNIIEKAKLKSHANYYLEPLHTSIS